MAIARAALAAGFLLASSVVASAGGGKAPKVIMFKRARSGSTWMSEIMMYQPNVAWFVHEAQGCPKPEKLLLSMLENPKCGPKDAEDLNNCKFYSKAKEEPGCLDNKMVGFDVSMSHMKMKWPDWGKWMKMEDTYPVLYIRSNLVKHAVGDAHTAVLLKLCGSHKTFGKGASCVEKNKKAFEKPLHLKPDALAKSAYKKGKMWKEIYEAITEAAGRPPFVMTYEALQFDPKAEIARLYKYVGLKDVGQDQVVIKSDSVKTTADDLSKILGNFAEIESFFKAKHTCLVDMLTENEPKQVFWKLCYDDGKDMMFPHSNSSRRLEDAARPPLLV